MSTQYCDDSIVNQVISNFINRSNFGKKKYGVTLDRNDLSVLEWIQHAQEEHMDAILYLEKLKDEIKNNNMNNIKPINKTSSNYTLFGFFFIIVAYIIRILTN